MTTQILCDIQNTLSDLVKRVEGTEKELKLIKERTSSSSSTDSTPRLKRKEDVPQQVRVCKINVYVIQS